MKIAVISYGIYGSDGRLKELLDVLSNIGECFIISRGKTKYNNNHFLFESDNYFHFIKYVKDRAKLIGETDILFLDNRKSVIPGWSCKYIFKSRVVIQDCRELYILSEVNHLSGKIGCLIEKYGILKADIIIAANEERAKYMRKFYNLHQDPIVFENIRELEYSESGKLEDIASKYHYLCNTDDVYTIISSAGCNVSRLTDVLVRNIDKVNYKCRLLLAGYSSEKDKQIINKIIKSKNLDNVFDLGRITPDELKYILSLSSIGIVAYHQNDLNNLYCASGKVYEFAYEGVPVVTTTNPGLKKMCEEDLIGVADDEFYHGINTIIENHDYYKKNIIEFSKRHTRKENIDHFMEKLKLAIHDSHKISD